MSKINGFLIRLPDNLKRIVRYQAGCNKRSLNQEINMILEDVTKNLEVPEDFK